jgi:hypothetical protein
MLAPTARIVAFSRFVSSPQGERWRDVMLAGEGADRREAPIGGARAAGVQEP